MDYEVIEFKDQASFRAWLEKHANNTAGVWLKMYKKASNIPTITHPQALDEALCFGWIDGQRKGYDDTAFLQKFTPRRAKSLWSKRNIEYIDRLTKAGLMTEGGLREVRAAHADGRWEAAYDGSATMQTPQFFLDMLEKNPKAKALYGELNRTNTYAIAWRLQTAKTEATRLRRAEKMIELFNEGKKIY